jgi:hypothetical protein
VLYSGNNNLLKYIEVEMEYAIEILEDDIGVMAQTVSLHELLMMNEVTDLKLRKFKCPYKPCGAELSVCYSEKKLQIPHFSALKTPGHIPGCLKDDMIEKSYQLQGRPTIKGQRENTKLLTVFSLPAEDRTRPQKPVQNSANFPKETDGTKTGNSSTSSLSMIINLLYENPLIDRKTYRISIPGFKDQPIIQCIRYIKNINYSDEPKNIPTRIYFGTYKSHEIFDSGIKIQLAERVASTETKAFKKVTIWIRKKAGLEKLFDYVFDPLDAARIGKTRIYFFGHFEPNEHKLHMEIDNVNLIHVSSVVHENLLK